MEIEIEDDPIVTEIPVYLSKKLYEQIFLLQYVLRPKYRPLDPPTSARMKIENNILELQYKINQDKENYDENAEEYLKQKNQVLRSTIVPSVTNYAIGVYRDNQLHLNPIQSIFQMKPNFPYIDKALDEAEEIDEDYMEIPIKKEEAKQVQVQLKKKESDEAAAARQNSYAYKKQLEDSEHWLNLQVIPKEDDLALDDFELLFNETKDEIEFNQSKKDYLISLKS